MKPELVVFGTSPLVSAELHTAIRRLFGDTYPVREALTEDAAREDPEKDACWIAAPIQYPHVSRFLPKEKTFLLDMQPAAEFFLAMTARVPEGAPISVFNNRKAYAERFIGQMKDRIRGNHPYTAISYEDMPEETVFSPPWKGQVHHRRQQQNRRRFNPLREPLQRIPPTRCEHPSRQPRWGRPVHL